MLDLYRIKKITIELEGDPALGLPPAIGWLDVRTGKVRYFERTYLLEHNMKTLQEQIKSVERELAMRRRVYPKWVNQKKMKQERADHEIACMEAVLETLTSLINFNPLKMTDEASSSADQGAKS